jgi:hypothetical protein
MPRKDAIKFFSDFRENNQLRNTLNGSLSCHEFEKNLKLHGYSFTPDEFEDSFHYLLFKCQTEEQANELGYIFGWYQLMYYH